LGASNTPPSADFIVKGFERGAEDEQSMNLYSYGAGAPLLTDPQGSSAILAATQWVSGTLLGTLATVIGVIAIAWVGLMMLSGHVDLRRGVSVVLGCFILFGAPTIVKGLRGFGDDALSGAYGAGVPRSNEVVTLPVLAPQPHPSPDSYDPYAGASLRP
jgi:type IV secretory pathway VirB2 component (pilin)